MVESGATFFYIPSEVHVDNLEAHVDDHVPYEEVGNTVPMYTPTAHADQFLARNDTLTNGQAYISAGGFEVTKGSSHNNVNIAGKLHVGQIKDRDTLSTGQAILSCGGFEVVKGVAANSVTSQWPIDAPNLHTSSSGAAPTHESTDDTLVVRHYQSGFI